MWEGTTTARAWRRPMRRSQNFAFEPTIGLVRTEAVFDVDMIGGPGTESIGDGPFQGPPIIGDEKVGLDPAELGRQNRKTLTAEFRELL